MLKAHGFHGARSAANVARMAGLAKYDSYIFKNATFVAMRCYFQKIAPYLIIQMQRRNFFARA